MNGRILSENTSAFIRSLSHVTIDEIARAVAGRPERELRPIEHAIIVAAFEPGQWSREGGTYRRI